MTEWQPIETATEEWVIGYASWGQQVGKFHEHVGPCERYKGEYQFANIDFDVFPNATHWTPWPAPPPRL